MITLGNPYKESIVELKRFPDNTLHLNLNENDTVPFPTIITWKYEDDAELFAIMCLKEKFDTIHDLRLSYLPNARQDRVQSDEDVFTLKTFCNIINSMNFENVWVLDCHSNVGPALLNNCTNISPKPYIEKVIAAINDPNLILFFPDEGAMKRYSKMIKKPYAFGIKERDWETGKITNLRVIDNGIDLTGANVLIIDDICSYGGTFVKSAQALREHGVNNIYLYVTHCEANIAKGEAFNHIDKVFTTNSMAPNILDTIKQQYNTDRFEVINI